MKTIASMQNQNEDTTHEIGRAKTLGEIGKPKDLSLVEVLTNDPIKIVNEMHMSRMSSGNSVGSRGSNESREKIKRSISRGKIRELVQTVQVFEMIKKPQQTMLKQQPSIYVNKQEAIEEKE